jgi:hypothetical protein
MTWHPLPKHTHPTRFEVIVFEINDFSVNFHFSINFLGVGLLTKEVFPTSVRNATFGVLDACSKVGAAIAPFLVDLLSLIDNGLPNLVMNIFDRVENSSQKILLKFF